MILSQSYKLMISLFFQTLLFKNCEQIDAQKQTEFLSLETSK